MHAPITRAHRQTNFSFGLWQRNYSDARETRKNAYTVGFFMEPVRSAARTAGIPFIGIKVIMTFVYLFRLYNYFSLDALECLNTYCNCISISVEWTSDLHRRKYAFLRCVTICDNNERGFLHLIGILKLIQGVQKSLLYLQHFTSIWF